jgi:septum formation protein
MDSLNSIELILASSSPRRKELLELAGFSFEIFPPTFDESGIEVDDPGELAIHLAISKAQDVANKFPKKLVLGADTIVVLPLEGAGFKILGKPSNEVEAEAMLRELSMRSHSVITAYSIICLERKIEISSSVSTSVNFRKLSDSEISKYIETKDPYDKAGAYGIQGFAACFVSSIEGSYTNVVGLPLSQVIEELRQLGVKHF